MPSAKDIKLDDNTSFLLIGDGGTHKTYFIGTCPKPAFVFDFDNGMAIHAGKDGIDYETFREVGKGEKLAPWQKQMGGWYEWGTAYIAAKAKLNEIGRSMDTGECKYHTIAFDSLTLLTDLVFSHTEKDHGGPFKDGRQQWGAFLNIMTDFFAQFVTWPVVKVLTAHIKRDENLTMGTVEKLPLVGGQFAGKVGVLFDEVYYTEVQTKDAKGTALPKPKFCAFTSKENSRTSAKSRKYNLPDGTDLDFPTIMAYVAKQRAATPK